jgi:hypothetical protein
MNKMLLPVLWALEKRDRRIGVCRLERETNGDYEEARQKTCHLSLKRL